MLELDSNRALLVDLYELTMAAAYFEQHVDCRATFELFVRQLPPSALTSWPVASKTPWITSRPCDSLESM